MTTPLQIRTKFDILPREGVRIFHFVCQRIFCVCFLAVLCFLIYLSCASSHIILDLIVRRCLCIHWTADNVLFFSFCLIECINVNTTTHHTSAKQLLYISKWIFFFHVVFERDVSMLTLDRRRNARQPPVEPFFPSKQIDAVPMSLTLAYWIENGIVCCQVVWFFFVIRYNTLPIWN